MSYGATYTIVNLIAKKIIYQTEPKELAIKKKNDVFCKWINQNKFQFNMDIKHPLCNQSKNLFYIKRSQSDLNGNLFLDFTKHNTNSTLVV